MYLPQKFTIQEIKGQKPDGLGGLIDNWVLFGEVSGYLDLLTGADNLGQQHAFVEESTHVVVLPVFTEGVTAAMRLVDTFQRYYAITYVDNPVNVNHHQELYVTFGGVLDETKSVSMGK